MRPAIPEEPILSPWLPVVLSLFVSFRLIALPFLLLSALPVLKAGGRRRRTIVLRAAYYLTLLSPIDVNLFGRYHGGGPHPSGPRLVRTVVGLPAHTSLIRRYGEYYSLGCSSYTMCSPAWMFVVC